MIILLISQKNERRAAVKKIALSITLIYFTTFWYLDAVEGAFASVGLIADQSTPDVVPEQCFTKRRWNKIRTELNKDVADYLKIVIAADSRISVLFDMSGKLVRYQSKYISNATI